MIEFEAQSEVSKGGREEVDGLVEVTRGDGKREDQQGRREVVYPLVELGTKGEVRKGDREGGDWLVEVFAKS